SVENWMTLASAPLSGRHDRASCVKRECASPASLQSKIWAIGLLSAKKSTALLQRTRRAHVGGALCERRQVEVLHIGSWSLILPISCVKSSTVAGRRVPHMGHARDRLMALSDRSPL